MRKETNNLCAGTGMLTQPCQKERSCLAINHIFHNDIGVEKNEGRGETEKVCHFVHSVAFPIHQKFMLQTELFLFFTKSVLSQKIQNHSAL